jgi:hypothetical protein
MKVTHELTIHGRCPVDDAIDTYEVAVEAARMVKVEDILGAVAALPQPAFQEDITQTLAAKLGCRVTTIGYHSGVKTTCRS